MNAQAQMTHQQELELLAKWMGKDLTGWEWRLGSFHLPESDHKIGAVWNPSPTGNSDDFLNMIAGRVDIEFWTSVASAKAVGYAPDFHCTEAYADHPNKLAAMKHAAYQVCLMAAREGKE